MNLHIVGWHALSDERSKGRGAGLDAPLCGQALEMRTDPKPIFMQRPDTPATPFVVPPQGVPPGFSRLESFTTLPLASLSRRLSPWRGLLRQQVRQKLLQVGLGDRFGEVGGHWRYR